MAFPTAVLPGPVDSVPGPVYRAAARSVTRVLVPAGLALLAVALLEVVSTGELLPLYLAAVTLLVLTMPGTLIATEAVARFRMDGTLRRMERDLGPGDAPA